MFFYSIKSYLAAIEDFKTYTRHIVCVFRLLFLIQLFSTTISIYIEAPTQHTRRFKVKTSRFLFSTGPYNTLFLPQTSLKRGKCISTTYQKGKIFRISAMRSIEKSGRVKISILSRSTLKKCILLDNFTKTVEKSNWEKKYHSSMSINSNLMKLDQNFYYKRRGAVNLTLLTDANGLVVGKVVRQGEGDLSTISQQLQQAIQRGFLCHH